MKIYKIFFLFLFIALSLTNLKAQSLEPRLYSNAPVDMNFLIVAYGYSSGALSLSPELELENPHLDVNLGIVAYIRAFGIYGKSAKVDVIVPYANISGEAMQNGVKLTRDVSGLGDIKARISVNIFGSPALSLKNFSNHKQDSIVGLSLQVTAPTGQYDNSKLINIGRNIWAVKPGIGASKAFGNFTLELLADAEFYSKNNDFISGKIEQEPIYSTQAHLIYNIKNGMWAAVDANYYWGGETIVNGVAKDNDLSNSRFGIVFAMPINKKNSVKINGSRGISTRTGTNFDNIVLAWQYRWGAGL